MGLQWSPCFAGILLVYLLVFVSNSSANNLTLVTNSSSTNAVVENSTDIHFPQKIESSSSVFNSSTSVPSFNGTSTSVLPPDNKSTSVSPLVNKATSVLPSNDKSKIIQPSDNESTSVLNPHIASTSVLPPDNNNKSTSVLSPDNKPTSTLPLDNKTTNVSLPDNRATSNLPLDTISEIFASLKTSSTVPSPSSKITSPTTSTSITKISNKTNEFSKDVTTNKIQISTDQTVPYNDIDEEIKMFKLSYDKIFKFKRKCCPLNKVFDVFDHCFTAICNDIPEDAPTVISFERHNDAAYLRGDALQSKEPFHCGGLEPFYYENVSVLPNGSMYSHEEGETFPFPDDPTINYCLEPISDNNLVMYRCGEENEPQPVAYKVVKIVNSVFLTGFIVVYMMKPNLHTLHNRCLMRLMICLLGKCVLSIIFHQKFSSSSCHERVFIIQYTTAAGTYFFYMASFCWTTVICYDIWYGILRVKSTRGLQTRESVQKKIRKYSTYGWGLASVILLIAVVIDFLSAGLPNTWLAQTLIAPEFAIYGDNWMGSNNAMYVYFYGPLLTLNVINLVFFVLTINTIIQVRRDNNNVFERSGCSRRHADQAEVKWFIVFSKLYILMGITWILDLIAFELSGVYQSDVFSKFVVYSLDIFNICQGILIFFITIFSKETARTLSKTFSATILKARGSLTNSKKVIQTDPTTHSEEDRDENRERGTSKERSECTTV